MLCLGGEAPGGAPEAVCVGSKGTVRLNARFDAGYFVSVRVVGQEFRGVLYYPPPAHVRSFAQAPLHHLAWLVCRSALLAAPNPWKLAHISSRLLCDVELLAKAQCVLCSCAVVVIDVGPHTAVKPGTVHARCSPST